MTRPRRYRSLRRIEPKEADTLRAIMDWLDLQQAQGKLVWIRHSPSNVVGKKGEARFRRIRESQKGIADLVVLRAIKQGRLWTCDVLCIEVKSPTGECSPDQSHWGELVMAQGARRIVARSLDEVRGALGE